MFERNGQGCAALDGPEPSDEVAVAFWVPVAMLNDPAMAVESSVTVRGATWRVPSYLLGGHIVWGMTERILKNLLALIAQPADV